MRKVDENKQKKKDALLNTAFDLFTTKGIAKTSIADIVEHAGVAKGTFYLYFSDKYDIRNKLIAHKASQIFQKALDDMQKEEISTLEDYIIFLVDHVLNQLNSNKSLLNFISKNLSWGIFKNALISNPAENDVDFFDSYTELFEKSEKKYQNPEILVYMIVEFVSATSYSAILYNEPVTIEELKPFMFESIRQIIRSMEFPD